MRRIMKAHFLIGGFVMISFAFANMDDAVMSDGKGIYHQTYCSGKYRYIVDSVTQTCYFCSGGITAIPCENLAKRPEWKSIITWVNK